MGAQNGRLMTHRPVPVSFWEHAPPLPLGVAGRVTSEQQKKGYRDLHTSRSTPGTRHGQSSVLSPGLGMLRLGTTLEAMCQSRWWRLCHLGP